MTKLPKFMKKLAFSEFAVNFFILGPKIIKGMSRDTYPTPSTTNAGALKSDINSLHFFI
jgi:hypothetical protein